MNRQAHASSGTRCNNSTRSKKGSRMGGNMVCGNRRILLALSLLLLLPLSAFAQSGPPCPRPAPGSVVPAPPDMFSQNGTLNVTFNYFTTMDSAGRTLFCFVTPNGFEGPTLHVKPGDTLNVTVTNLVPAPPPGSPTEVVSNPSNKCGDLTMTITSVNVHYHGTNTSPTCQAGGGGRAGGGAGGGGRGGRRGPAGEPPG